MPYLLDGNNLIGVVRKTARPSEQDRAALISEIADRLRQTRARATIFFDGPAGARASSLGGLTVRTADGESADDAIVREVQRARTPGELVVVTADRGLTRRVRDAGAKVTPPQDFFARFGAAKTGTDAHRGVNPSATDVEEWMRYFEDERNRS
ncbi:MAG: NYN domain-containing protein [Acidobacteriota bacterium]